MPNRGQASSNDRPVIEGAGGSNLRGVTDARLDRGGGKMVRDRETEKERKGDASHEQTLLFSSRLLPRLLACSSCWKAGWTCWTSWLMDPHCTPPINLPPPPPPTKALDYFPTVTKLKQLPTISTPWRHYQRCYRVSRANTLYCTSSGKQFRNPYREYTKVLRDS